MTGRPSRGASRSHSELTWSSERQVNDSPGARERPATRSSTPTKSKLPPIATGFFGFAPPSRCRPAATRHSSRDALAGSGSTTVAPKAYSSPGSTRSRAISGASSSSASGRCIGPSAGSPRAASHSTAYSTACGKLCTDHGLVARRVQRTRKKGVAVMRLTHANRLGLERPAILPTRPAFVAKNSAAPSPGGLKAAEIETA